MHELIAFAHCSAARIILGTLLSLMLGGAVHAYELIALQHVRYLYTLLLLMLGGVVHA